MICRNGSSYFHAGNGESTSLIGVGKDQNSRDRVWSMLVALGNVALASSYSQIAIDIQVSDEKRLYILQNKSDMCQYLTLIRH